MPSISRIRITNLVYENGAKRYGDETFQFDSHNGVILLENGGGKTVFVQAVLQTILPHITLADRKAKDTFSLENSPAHLAVEWLLNEKPRRYALTAVTLFSSKEGMDSYKYAYEYEAGDEHSLERLPLVREGPDRRLRPASKEEMADYYQSMNRNHLTAKYFSSNREYQDYIEENFKIISSEWRSVARINSAEGEIEGFFEGCRTTTQLVDKLLIPTVEEALAGNGSQDFVETFERQREHFKKHRQLRDKIKESQQVDAEITRYVNLYSSYEEAWQVLLKVKGETKALYQLALEQQGQSEQRLEEHQLASSKLQEARYELERKQASYQLAILQELLENARQQYEDNRAEYTSQLEEFKLKNHRLYNLEIAQQKARIRSSEEEMNYLTEQIKTLSTDPNIQDLEMKIRNNAGFLRYSYLNEEDNLANRQRELQTEHEQTKKKLLEAEADCRAKQDEYQKLLVKKGQAEQQRDQAEKEMQKIVSQILANPRQEDVLQEKKKWEGRIGELERDRHDNEAIERQLTEEKQQIQTEMPQLRQELQACHRVEQSLKTLLDHIEEKHEFLLLRMKEMRSELYSINSLYTQQSTVLNQFEDAVENLRVLKERAILKESQALALYTLYEPNSYYAADPLLEQWIEDGRERFTYLELGAVYVEKAARQLAQAEVDYFKAYPFWAISLICQTSEADLLLARLKKQADQLTHPVFILTQEEARKILDSRGVASIQGAERRVFPSSWEVNLSPEAFQSWKQELELSASEASSERKQQENQLQMLAAFLQQLKGFLEKYSYEEYRQWQQSWRETREQQVDLEQRVLSGEKRLAEIDVRLSSLGKKLTENIEEHAHLSHRIMQAQDYIRRAGERDNARLAVQQYQELLLPRQKEILQIERQKDRLNQRLQELQKDQLIKQEDLRHLRLETLYQDVMDALPLESKLSRLQLQTERQGIQWIPCIRSKKDGRAWKNV